MSASFAVGDQVECRGLTGEFEPAIITAVLENGNYSIKTDDGLNLLREFVTSDNLRKRGELTKKEKKKARKAAKKEEKDRQAAEKEAKAQAKKLAKKQALLQKQQERRQKIGVTADVTVSSTEKNNFFAATETTTDTNDTTDTTNTTDDITTTDTTTADFEDLELFDDNFDDFVNELVDEDTLLNIDEDDEENSMEKGEKSPRTAALRRDTANLLEMTAGLNQAAMEAGHVSKESIEVARRASMAAIPPKKKTPPKPRDTLADVDDMFKKIQADADQRFHRAPSPAPTPAPAPAPTNLVNTSYTATSVPHIPSPPSPTSSSVSSDLMDGEEEYAEDLGEFDSYDGGEEEIIVDGGVQFVGSDKKGGESTIPSVSNNTTVEEPVPAVFTQRHKTRTNIRPSPQSKTKTTTKTTTTTSGRPLEQTREHISASQALEAPWTSLLIQDAIGANTGGVKLTDEERIVLRTASESQSVLVRLQSQARATGASFRTMTVLDNYGRMVDGSSLAKDVDNGARTYGDIIRRKSEISHAQTSTVSVNMVDIVDSARYVQVEWLFDICTGTTSPIATAQRGAAERRTYDEMEQALLAIPMANDSSVAEHTRCLKQMLRLLETCFRGGGTVRTSTHAVMSVTRDELMVLSSLGDRVEHLEQFFEPLYLKQLREGYLQAVESTSLAHLSGNSEVPWLPPIKVLDPTFESKISTLKEKIYSLEVNISTQQKNASNALEDRLQTAYSSGHYHRLLEKKNATKKALVTQATIQMAHAPLTLHKVGDKILVDDNFGSWVPAVVIAVLENGQAYSANMENGLKRGFIPASGVKPYIGESVTNGENDTETHDWDSLRADVEKTLHFLGQMTVESRQQNTNRTGGRGNGYRHQKDVLEYFQERLSHYDLIKDGWIRHKEFSHAMEDVYGWSLNAATSDSSRSEDNGQTLESIVESLYPFLDPEGRGHVEYPLIIEHIKGHVADIVSSNRTELDRTTKALDRALHNKMKMEKHARKGWTHQPALMIASWPDMNQLVFSGVPDHLFNAMSQQECLSVTLDAHSIYGVSSSAKGATLQKSWLNGNLSPERRREKMAKSMHYVPKWSSKMFGLYSKNPRKNPTQDKWNGMPVLTMNEKVGAGLKQQQNGEKAFVDGVTWGHLLAGLWYQRRDVLLNLSKETVMLSYKTRSTLERAARLDDMSTRHSKQNHNRRGKKRPLRQKNNDENNGQNNSEQPDKVDFVTRMDRKLRATRIKLEQQRQAEFKRDREAANHTNKTWEEVQTGFFKRLNQVSPSRHRLKEEVHHKKMQRLSRTSGGKAALDLERRSGHGFNALCERALKIFRRFDVDGSGWTETKDLPMLLDSLGHVAQGSDDNWIDYATRELDRNENGAIALKDFIAWWASQCPACFPLRGCYPEINIDVRRIALDADSAKWIHNKSQGITQLVHEYGSWSAAAAETSAEKRKNKKDMLLPPLVPMVCESCWSEYKRGTFCELYDDRKADSDRVERMRTMQRKQLQKEQLA